MTLAHRLAEVTERAAAAAALSGRSIDDLTIIPVTKFHPPSLIRELHSLGVRDFAENRHQEARQKAADLADLDGLRWNFVGQLQGKKARQVRGYARTIHSIDRQSLVDALASETVTTSIFLQVNLTDDPDRGGVRPDDIESLAVHALAAPGIRLLGLMAVAPLDEDPRGAFARVRELSDKLRLVAPDAVAISTGMSGDFEAAIAEGTTHLRIGTAITGNRPEPG
ncbi:YggS family pyridoxal phosphate-dependent enzyme [Agreia sp. COWG]|uniref:YggS family pyridoxal phosphate-dependent enzyme n=1 Tax=Agreia sp. COWG TaxID=2773266 RepID=UPI0019287F6E|nr:YggS family pyridoxal phosphate-dependent enzyme [Agreia sp. COWG]CAD5997555.1 Pyridoxal phosphate homeostasis protein [Agreia sp. COWG]